MTATTKTPSGKKTNIETDLDSETTASAKVESNGPKFSDFNLDPNILRSLEDMGFTTPTPIQSLAIPVILEGKDVVAQAQTGTGKTAAFGLPSLHMIQESGAPGIQILILTPTRELAQQVGKEMEKLGKYLKLQIATIIGGKSYRDQRESLKRARVLIATPGRLTDLITSGAIPGLAPQFLVLDEADRMLDMGFADDLEKIVQAIPKERQTLLFSATFAPAIKRLSQNMTKPDRQMIKVEASTETNPDIEQIAFVMNDSEKDESLYRLIDFHRPVKTLIFCEMKRDADRLGTVLNRKGYRAQILHGDTEQRKREEVMAQFRKQKEGILVATDLAGRGLDVSDISHVINFQIPSSRDSYVHRIGRTGRAGMSGVAMNLVNSRELRELQRWADINKASVQVQSVPTLASLRRQAMDALKTKLTDIQPSMMALESLTQLADGEGVDQLALKLLEIYIKGLNFQGPERLGWTEEDLKRGSSPRAASGGNAGRGRYEDRPRAGGRGGGRSYGGDRGGGGFGGGRGRSSDRPERSDDRPQRSFDRSDRAPRFEGASADRPERSERPERSNDRPVFGVRTPRDRNSSFGDSAERAPRASADSAERAPRASFSERAAPAGRVRDRADRGEAPSAPSFGAARTRAPRAGTDERVTRTKSEGGRTVSSDSDRAPSAGRRIRTGGRPPAGGRSGAARSSSSKFAR